MKDYSLQFIAHHNARYTYVQGIQLALQGGCRWIQLRMKGASQQELIATGKVVVELCHKVGATLIVDDDVQAALCMGADGVHLGKNDMPIHEARKMLGNEMIIGGTANTFDDIRRIYAEGANYIGCGPFRFTTTKERLSPILGEEGYKRLHEQMLREGMHIPMVAIGGITLQDVPLVMQTGVDGIALSGAILNADDPVAETAKLRTTIQSYHINE